MNTILGHELKAFVEAGRKVGFVAPYSVTEGDYQGKHITVHGRKSIDLTRLDYVSLGQNEQVRHIMKECINNFNTACPGSQMVIRTASSIRLEEAVANFHGMDDAILFLSGYSANDNVIAALAFRMRIPHLIPYIRIARLAEFSNIPTGFFVDEETHFSLIHSIKFARLSLNKNCVLQRYCAANYEHLIQKLEKSHKIYGEKMIRVIVTDTLSSMSGKLYDVKILCEIAEKYDCMLYLDEAHAMGVIGREGGGVASDFSEIARYRERILVMGTFTKAIAQLGGYVAMPSKDLGDFLRSASPHYIFSAPIPPWMAEVNIQVLDMIRGEYGREERQKLQTVSSHMRTQLLQNGFDILGSESHIIPLLGGEEEKTFRIKSYLQEKGFTTTLCECPVVPKGKSIIRFSLCSDITCDEVDQLVTHILTARKKFVF